MSNKIDDNAVFKRHLNVWKISRLLAPLYIKNKLGYTYDIAPETFKAPYLVLSNHNSNFDPVLLGLSFPQHMYFMASEQVYRAGFKSKILKWTFEPISKIKGATDALAVAKALRKLRAGKNVCLFPEGNRSFNGKTWRIENATGKLVKVSGAALVTYRLEGVYLSNPRWGTGGVRKGRIHGRIVHYYTAEELKGMSADEITRIIHEDIYEDAYAIQEKNPVRYKGKNKAEGMECAVCVCPECRSIDSIATKGDTVFCKKCGMSTQYDDYGFFGDGFKFHNLTQWDEWQTEFYRQYIQDSAGTEEPLFFDTDVRLSKITDDHRETPVGKGTFRLFKDRMDFLAVNGGGYLPHDIRPAEESGSPMLSIPLESITAISVFNKCVLCFSDKDGTHYEMRPTDKKQIKNFRKYTSALEILKGIGSD